MPNVLPVNHAFLADPDSCVHALLRCVRNVLLGCIVVLAFAMPLKAQAPVLTALYPNSGTASSQVSAVIRGTNLSNATLVSFSGAGVSAAIQPGGTATNLPITITVAGNAALGVRSVSVTTPGGQSLP